MAAEARACPIRQVAEAERRQREEARREAQVQKHSHTRGLFTLSVHAFCSHLWRHLCAQVQKCVDEMITRLEKAEARLKALPKGGPDTVL